MIIRLQHVGLALENLQKFSDDFGQLFGSQAVQLRKDQDNGLQFDSRIMFPNNCWLHCVQNWNPEACVNRFLQRHGEGLEHICLETDDIEADVARLRKLGVPIFQETIFNTTDGLNAFVYPEDAIGFMVELIQPHETSWNFDASLVTNPNVLGLQHIGVGVRDVGRAAERFERLFGLKAAGLRTDQHYGEQRDVAIIMGNDALWLHLVETTVPEHRVYQFIQKYGGGLEHLCIEVADIRQAVRRVQSANVPIEQNKIYLDRADGFEAFVCAEHNHGITVELIEPYPTSRGCRSGKGQTS